MFRCGKYTILDVVGLEIPDTVDGKSVLSLIKGQESDWREYIHGEHCTCYSEEQEMQYLTDGKWKYIWFPRLGMEQLFNLQEDPGECNDLSQDESYRDELLKWRERLIKELEPRKLGLTDGKDLVCQKGRLPIISLKYEERMRRSGFDWLKYGEFRRWQSDIV